MSDNEEGIYKVVSAVLGVFILLAMAAIPYIAAQTDKDNKRQWQTQGCHMYDELPMSKVPAKCQQYFVDHYAPQSQRTQPEEN